MKQYNFHNQYHYGDCLISLHFLIRISQKNNIICNFQCNSSYHNQLQELIPDNTNVFLTDFAVENSYDLWGAKLLHKVQEKYQNNYPLYCENYPEYQDIFRMTYEMWNCFAEDLGLVIPFDNKSEILFDESPLGQDISLNYDYLIVNSYCLSGQVKYSQSEQDSIFFEIIDSIVRNNKSFITTHKLKDYPSTQDIGMSLVQIGQLSKNCNVVIGVPTSPFWISINKWSFRNCEKFINLTHDSCTYDLGNKFITVNCLEAALQYL